MLDIFQHYSKMEKNFKDSENEEINSLKHEISSLKADLMNKEDTVLDENVDDTKLKEHKEDTDLDDNVEDTKSKKDEEELAEAQRLIKEIQSRKLD